MKTNYNVILFDDHTHGKLLPLTFTKPIGELRIGITTIKEKWEHHLGQKCSYLTSTYLQGKYPCRYSAHNLYINASFIPTLYLLKEIGSIDEEIVLKKEGKTVAFLSNAHLSFEEINALESQAKKSISSSTGSISISNTWDIFRLNGPVLENDFNEITKNRVSAPISKTNNLIDPENIFVEEGATLEFTTLNAKAGPIYIGKNAEIMEGSVIRGGFALCNNSVVKLLTKVYGPTTIGPHCKVGGELNNVIFQSFSNKAHDGFLGNSVIGEWCNLGADTNNSNLKNNYAKVKLWDYGDKKFVNTGLQFCGLIMGDHSKCGINTMFNTGTVVGVSANIFGSGFPRNFIPSFSWGGPGGTKTYQLEKAFETANTVMNRRDIELSETDKGILEHIYNLTQEYRTS